MKNSIVSLLLAGCLVSATSFASVCRFELDQNSVKINWTAFKTMQKVAVNGYFSEVTLVGDLSVKGNLMDLLSQLEAELSVNSSEMIKTGNPGRDQTLYDHFFKLFKQKAFVTGEIQKVVGNDHEGSFNLNLKMNGKALAVPMRYNRSADGVFEAKGGIDVLDFGLSSALNDLHLTCEKLHQGPDGVSKTWPIVEIKLQAKIAQKCSS